MKADRAHHPKMDRGHPFRARNVIFTPGRVKRTSVGTPSIGRTRQR